MDIHNGSTRDWNENDRGKYLILSKNLFSFLPTVRFRNNSVSSVGHNEPVQTGRAEVKLNVYDMVSMANFNQYSSPIGFGVFHSGAEIYGCEYAYGGHNNSHSGVFEIAPRDVVALGVDSFRFRETIVIGYTNLDEDEVKQIVDQFGEKFRGDKYHLLHQNCNHFTDALTRVSIVGYN